MSANEWRSFTIYTNINGFIVISTLMVKIHDCCLYYLVFLQMMSQEDNIITINEFLERGEKRVLIISQAPNGQLIPSTNFPSGTKLKAIYFMKRHPEALNKNNVKNLLYGDMSHLPLDQLSSVVESVI